MRHIKPVIHACFLTAAVLLSGCATDADDDKTIKALSQAIAADLGEKTLESLPINKSFTTNFKGARQIVVGRKVGNVRGVPNCALFDITVSRPSSFFALFKGDSEWQENVKVCVPAPEKVPALLKSTL